MRVPVFLDCEDNPERFFPGEALSVQSQLGGGQLDYRWHPPIGEGREPVRISEELQIEMAHAQREAKLQIAMEALVDELGGET